MGLGRVQVALCLVSDFVEKDGACWLFPGALQLGKDRRQPDDGVSTWKPARGGDEHPAISIACREHAEDKLHLLSNFVVARATMVLCFTVRCITC